MKELTKRPWKCLLVFILPTLLLLSLSAPLFADDLTPEEQAFFNQRTSDIVRFEISKLDNLAVEKVFAALFYSVKVVIKIADGEQSSTHVVARMGNNLVPVLRPSTDGYLQEFHKLLSPEFKLRGDADAKALQQALDVLYPPIMESEKKLLSRRHEGNDWIFVRGEFFNSKSGYIFETGTGGDIKSVRYLLRLEESKKEAEKPVKHEFNDPYQGGTRLSDGGGEPGKAYMALIEAVYKKDYAQICRLMADGDEQLAQCLNTKEIPESIALMLGNPKGHKVLDGSMKEDEATLDVLYIWPDLPDSYGFVIMKLQKGKWLISSLGGSGSTEINAQTSGAMEITPAEEKK